MEMDPKNLRYEGEDCIYTDPDSKYEYKWDKEKNEWLSNVENSEKPNQSAENQTNLPDNHNYEFDGKHYIHTDKESGIKYIYDNKQNKWVVKEEEKESAIPRLEINSEGVELDEDEEKPSPIKQDMSKGTYSYDGKTALYTDPKDATVYFWDVDKNAWFPKVDDDFLANYQMNYGFVDNSEKTEDKVPEKPKTPPEVGRKRAANPPTWFDVDDENNTKVYVSGLPLDITEQEFIDFMQKCGLVMRDINTNKWKIKLYSEKNSKQLKGDALCTYIKVESVDLALKILDGADLRGNKIHIERAKFQMKGDYDPSLKPKKRKNDKEKVKKLKEKLFAWAPDQLRGVRPKHERVVIIRNLFDSTTFEQDVALISEYKQDLREEADKFGAVTKLTIFDRHPEGVAQINYKDPEEADLCVKLLNNRWFCQRQLKADLWDGKEKFRVAESAKETAERLQNWDKFLEDEAKKEDDNKSALKKEQEEKSTPPMTEEEGEVSTPPMMEEEDEVSTAPMMEEEGEVSTPPMMEEEGEVSTPPMNEEKAEKSTTMLEEEDEDSTPPMMEEEDEVSTPPMNEEKVEKSTTMLEEEEKKSSPLISLEESSAQKKEES